MSLRNKPQNRTILLKFTDSSAQLSESSIKKEVIGKSVEDSKLEEDYLSGNHGFEKQDPDELMTNEEENRPGNIDNGTDHNTSTTIKVNGFWLKT